MKTFFAINILCLFGQIYAFAQQISIPNYPNQMDKMGRRQGMWKICFDKDWNALKDCQKAVYFRVIKYENNTSIGRVRDYYLNGVLQWEGELISDQPQEIFHGKNIWYRQDGTKEMVRWFERGKLLKEVHYNLDGSLQEDNWETVISTGLNFYQNGDYINALSYLLKATTLAEKEFGKNHVNYALSIDKLASVHIGLGNYDKAEPLLFEAKDIYILNSLVIKTNYMLTSYIV